MHRWLGTIVAGWMLLAAPFAGAVQADGGEPDVKPEHVEFEQQKAAGHMRELEGRMFRVADLLRETEPDPAARLRLALSVARDELIVEQMNEIRALVDAGRLEQARDAQNRVIAKLQRLRSILTDADIELLLKLERLAAIEAALKKLEKITAEQSRQRNAADNAKDAQRPDDNELKQLGADQTLNRRATELLETEVRDAVPSECGAPADLQSAASCMQSSELSLSKRELDKTVESQQSAIDRLEEARKALETELEKLREEIAERALAAIMDLITEAARRQEQVRLATDKLSAASDRAEAAESAPLAAAQLEIPVPLDRAIELCERARFSVALPLALRDIQARMRSVGEQLRQRFVGRPVVEAQEDIERRLADLIDILKQRRGTAQRAGRPSQGGCKSCNQRAKLIAELRMIRGLQVDLNQRTIQTDGRRPAEEELSAALAEAVRDLSGNQKDIHDATMDVHDRFCTCGRGATPPAGGQENNHGH